MRDGRIVLVDAYAQIFRCFYAMRVRLTNAAGEPTAALLGMAHFLLEMEKNHPSPFGAFVFDKGKCTARLALCPEYKAQRPPMPDDLKAQVGKIRQWIQAFGWQIVEEEGREADDLLAALAVRHGELPVTVVTRDKDLTQLTEDPAVTLAFPEKNSWSQTDAAAVQAKFGVAPRQIADYLALLGDTADNIAGIPGIGPKTASKLLQEYGDAEGILQHADEIASPKIASSLKENAELLRRNLALTRLDDRLPQNPPTLPTVRKAPDWEAIYALASAEGFQSLLSVIDKNRKSALQPEFFF